MQAANEQVEQVVPPVEVAKRGHAQSLHFAAETARATGQSRQDVNRKTRRATEVCQEARDLIRGTKLDTGTFLDRLAKAGVSPKEQVDRVRAERKAGEMLAAMPKAKGTLKRGPVVPDDYRGESTLADLGVTKAQSSRWQKLAAVSAHAARCVGRFLRSRHEKAAPIRRAFIRTGVRTGPALPCGNDVSH